MTLEFASFPLAFAAGALSILSPCVWPLVPVVMSSASTGGRWGPLYLALGLSVSFAVAGTALSFVLVNLGLDPEIFRIIAAVLLLVVAVMLLVPFIGDRVSGWLARMGPRSAPRSDPESGAGSGSVSGAGQFGVGALLGIVWLPCVGPTLGAAIALASMGQNMLMAFGVMATFGIGTALVLIGTGRLSGTILSKWRPKAMAGAAAGKKILGVTLGILGLLVLTGVDKYLEALAIGLLPDWVYGF